MKQQAERHNTKNNTKNKTKSDKKVIKNEKGYVCTRIMNMTK